jgi:filamentous hemagglutinin family protein
VAELPQENRWDLEVTQVKKTITVFLIFGIIFYPQMTFALPQGETVVSGTASFDRSQADQLTVNQGTDKLIVDYQSFSIGQPELVKFLQPSTSSVALNRVVGGDPSSILGSLQSNGIIYLINPNGVVFGPGSQVDVGGLVASALNITNDDFLSGRYQFSGEGGVLINKGTISAPGGYVALLGSGVLNTGVIVADLGTVALAAGESITLNLDAKGLIGVVIDQATSKNLTGQDAAIVNQGNITADGGKVLINAQALNTVFDKAINTTGIVQARSLEVKDGEVALVANGNISIAGEINGGDVTIESTEGNVTHDLLSEVTTQDGNFRGAAGKDYILKNGASVNAGDGMIDILAGDNIILGDVTTDSLLQYQWEYVSGERGYKFLEFGYYLNDAGKLIYYPLVQGADIGEDNLTPVQGSGFIYEASANPELFTMFTRGDTNLFYPSDKSGKDTWVYYSDPTLNEDGLEHVQISSETQYGWEDIWGLGDQDFNDAVVDFRYQTIDIEPGVTLSSTSDIFLTAVNGGIQQIGGAIQTENLMLSTNTGITISGENVGLHNSIANISAVNHGSGEIKFKGTGDLVIADLTGETGLNTGVTGTNGITNEGVGGKIDIAVGGNLNIAGLVTGHGDISLAADGDIVHGENGNITIEQDPGVLAAPQKVISTSHEVGVWSNNDTIDVLWDLPIRAEGTFYQYTAQAGGEYTMAPGSEVRTNNGDATITANGDIRLALVDANNGNVAMTSTDGSILDNDLSQVPTDYDVIGHNIKLQADNGEIGGTAEEEEIDLGYPQLTFSYIFDLNNDSIPDQIADTYQAALNADGDWEFTTSYQTTQESDNWWFHIATLEITHNLISPEKHLGPFLIDTTAPVIFADKPEANQYSWYNSDVLVKFYATDNLSGFAPEGALTKDLNSETVSQEGSGLKVTSDGIFDRAGNEAEPIEVALNIDKTAPVISAGEPSGTQDTEGNYVSPVTVPFSAEDNLSGIAPDGEKQKDLDSKTTSGTGGGLTVTSDGVSDLAGNSTPGISAGPFLVLNDNPAPPPSPNPLPNPALFSANSNLLIVDTSIDENKVYYEVLNPSRFVSFEPVMKLGFYAYHPLAETDMSAFREIDLDVRAFEFIDNNIERKKQLAPYFEIR